MMRFFIRRQVLLMIVVALSLPANHGVAQTPTDAVTLTISTKETPVPQGQHLILDVAIANHTTQLLTMNYITTFSSFGIHIQNEHDEAPKETPAGCSMH